MQNFMLKAWEKRGLKEEGANRRDGLSSPFPASGETMWDVIRRVYRLADDRVSLGLIHLLSSGLIDRVELTKQAVLMAALPWATRRGGVYHWILYGGG